MNRIAQTVISAFLALGFVRLAAGDFTLTFRGGYFRPSDATFKQIYGPGPIFSLEFSAGISKAFAVWVEGSHFSRAGTLTLTREPTRLWLIPGGAGLKFILPAGPFHLYAGAGGGYFKLVETNRIGTVSPGRLGIMATAGVFYQAPGGWLVDAGLKYSYCRMRPAEFDFGVGGFEAGLGIGYSLPGRMLARASGGEKKVEFALSAGVKQISPNRRFSPSGASLWLGGNVDLHLGKRLMICPEIVIEPAGFGTITPGATLNYEIGVGYFGAGLAAPISLSGGNAGFERISPKIQLGLIIRHLRLAAGLIFRAESLDTFLGVGYQGLAKEPGQASPSAAAERPAGKTKMEFSLSAGLATNLGRGESFAFLLYSLGGQLDIDLGGQFLLSPEVLLYTSLRTGGTPLLLPAALVNYKLGKYFVGAGAASYIGLSAGSGFHMYPKFNVGYRGEHVTLTGYLVTSFNYFFQAGVAGANLGYRF